MPAMPSGRSSAEGRDIYKGWDIFEE